ncbi:hypothetical protein ES703_95293 [subsurface metagenome]
MQPGANAVSYQFPYHAIARTLSMLLDGVADITHVAACPSRLNTPVKAFPGPGQKLPAGLVNLADRKGAGMITIVALLPRPHIDSHNLPFLQGSIVRNTVDNLILDGNTQGGRIAVQSLETRFRFLASNICLRGSVQLYQCNAGFDLIRHQLQRFGDDATAPSYLFHLPGAAYMNHGKLSTAKNAGGP